MDMDMRAKIRVFTLCIGLRLSVKCFISCNRWRNSILSHCVI